MCKHCRHYYSCAALIFSARRYKFVQFIVVINDAKEHFDFPGYSHWIEKVY